jgi:hypothetical protein
MPSRSGGLARGVGRQGDADQLRAGDDLPAPNRVVAHPHRTHRQCAGLGEASAVYWSFTWPPLRVDPPDRGMRGRFRAFPQETQGDDDLGTSVGVPLC